MSLIKSNAVQIGQSSTATQNFTLSVPSAPDGTIKLARGNSGATTQDVLSVDASNNINGLVKATGSTTSRSLANRFADVVNVLDFGADPTGAVDSTTAIQSALNAANGKILDFKNGNYIINNFLNVTFTSNTTFRNGSVKLTGNSNLEYMIRIKTTSDLYIDNFIFDGNNNASKVVLINPNSSTSNIYIDKVKSGNGLQTSVATSFSVGIQIEPETTNNIFASAKISNSIVHNCTSNKPYTVALTSVGRGIYISDCNDAMICNCSFEDIGPSSDGDGCVFASDSNAFLSALVSNCFFKDCAKRSIKSQVANTTVNNCNFTRTQSFAYSGGQSEIGLLRGGLVNGISFYYPNGTMPDTIISFIYNDIGASCAASNVKVSTEDKNDVINTVINVSNYLDGSTLEGCSISNINIGCKVKNIVTLYTSGQTTNINTFNNLELNDITLQGYNTSNSESAIFFLTRANESYNNSSVRIKNIISRDGSIVPLNYLDTVPGITTYLSQELIEVYNALYNNATAMTGWPLTTKTYRFFVAENATLSKEFSLNSNVSSLIVTITYTSARDAAFNKLFTQGICQSSSVRVYYNELMAGIKSSAQTGAISITPSTTENKFTISKTAGSTSSTGTLIVTIQDIGYISQVI